MLKGLLSKIKIKKDNRTEFQKIKDKYWWKFEGYCICKRPIECCPRCCANWDTVDCLMCEAVYLKESKAQTYFKPVKKEGAKTC